MSSLNINMEIIVKTFAAAREAFGFQEKKFVVGEGSTVGQVLEMLTRECPGAAPIGNTLLCAVNAEYSAKEKVLHANDILALFPPVSGG